MSLSAVPLFPANARALQDPKPGPVNVPTTAHAAPPPTHNEPVIGHVDGLPILPNPKLTTNLTGVHQAKWATVSRNLYHNGTAPSQQVDIKDVRQGFLGDCWFQAAEGALVLRDPSMITKIITPIADAPGMVRVAFPGRRQFAMDETLPVLKNDSSNDKGRVIRHAGEPVFGAHATRGPLWSAMTEKGLAALTDAGYRKPNRGGQVYWGFKDLTGVQPVKVTAPDDLAQDLFDRVRAGQPIVLGSRPVDNATDKNEFGVYGGHAYIVDKATTYQGQPAVTLLNPWGVDSPPHPLTREMLQKSFDAASTDREWFEIPKLPSMLAKH